MISKTPNSNYPKHKLSTNAPKINKKYGNYSTH